MAYTFIRGHEVLYDWDKKEWFFADTWKSNIDSRSCIHCGKMPTKEGHDACLRFLKGVKNACCGHGIKEGYFQYIN